MYFLKELLVNTLELGASDLHLTVAVPPTVRKNGKLIKIGNENLLPEDIEKFAREILEEKYEEYLETPFTGIIVSYFPQI